MVLDFIEILKVIFLGIVEGITECLPISSTGHMILVDEFITLNMSEAFKEMFFVVIQLGAILAVVVMFWNKMFPFQFKNKAQSIVKKDTFSLWFKVAVACHTSTCRYNFTNNNIFFKSKKMIFFTTNSSICQNTSCFLE